MTTFFREQFGAGQGVILGVQGTQEGANSTLFEIVEIKLDQTNLAPKRTGFITMQVNSDVESRQFTLYFDMTDEVYDQRTLQGYSKKRNPKAVTR